MTYKFALSLMASLSLLVNTGCVPFGWQRSEVRTESRKHGLERLQLSAMTDPEERAEFFIPPSKWFAPIQARNPESCYILRRYNSLTKLYKKGTIEFFHTHRDSPYDSDKEHMQTVFPSKKDFQTFGDNPYKIKLGVVSPFAITYFEYEKGSNTSRNLDIYWKTTNKIIASETNAFEFIERGYFYQSNGITVNVVPNTRRDQITAK